TGLKGSYDALEGYPSFYNRTQIPVVLDDGRELDAWIYHIDEEQKEGVAHGDWVKYLEENPR
ncbi:gamma-glutamylcyclotransferase family protein, partial [Herbiconiux daphne]